MQTGSDSATTRSAAKGAEQADRTPNVSPPASAPAVGDAPWVEANDLCSAPRISADGTVVVFESAASNLVDGDTNAATDVFRVVLATGSIERVSSAPDGGAGNAASWAALVSADGRRVAFASDASNLVAGDGNAATDVFVRSWPSGEVIRPAAQLAAHEPNGFSRWPDISDNGRRVAFVSFASNLVDRDTNSAADVFLVELGKTGVTRVSVASTGAQVAAASAEPRFSGDATAIAFSSPAPDLVLDDRNQQTDVFVNAMSAGRTRRASIGARGEANGHSSGAVLSSDGRVVAFESWGSNLVDGDFNSAPDIFVHDFNTGRTTRVSVRSDGGEAGGHCRGPAISANGRFVAFNSFAENLVDGDNNYMSDVFVHDRERRTTARVSVRSGGAQANKDSETADISADGRLVVFQSVADNLVANDTNKKQDIFVHDRATGETVRVSARLRQRP
jgi:Tol biopolymer transport system component